MQQFTVPQFIDVEDKIIGPVTTRQFIIMLAGFLLMGIAYKFFDFSLFITVALILFVVCGTLAFAKINGRPFHFFILNVIQTLKRPNLRIWNKKNSSIEAVEEEDKKTIVEFTPAPVKHYTKSRLAELSLIVDTKGAYKGEEREDTEIKR